MRAFIFGLLIGASGVAGWFWMNQPPEVVIAEDYLANETAILATESDLLRLLLLTQIKGMSASDAQALLIDLNVYSNYLDEKTLLVAALPERPGAINIETRAGVVVDIHNYCTLYGPECPGQLRDDF